MEITITIPEELTNQLHTYTHELERCVREKIAVELYRKGRVKNKYAACSIWTRALRGLRF